ncbi:MAG: NAD-dependent epimerase [Pseudomonadota bacterium]
MKFLVTGVAGFIGYHTTLKLLKRGTPVVGIDMVNDYYDVALKEARLANLHALSKELDVEFTLLRENIANADALNACFEAHKPSRVINLAAQAGVRYSLENPHAYVESNVVGFTNLLEACRHHEVEHLTYASTSSVYGANKNMPFSEHNGVDHPLQFYAATKRANELMAHSYSHLFGIPTTGLRFFTVYGPWGRPDMALFLFTKNIIEGKPITVFNYGNHTRDFTFVEDIVEGVVRVADQPATPNPDWDGENPDPCTSSAPYRVYNIGNNAPVKLMDYVAAVETALDKKAEIEYLPMQLGDVPNTFADVSELQKAVNYTPPTGVEKGVKAFVDWYRLYYKV